MLFQRSFALPFVVTLFASYLPATTLAQSSSQKVTCPVIVSLAAKKYEKPNTKHFACYKTTTAARSKGYRSGTFLTDSTVRVVHEFGMDGQGLAYTPAFTVASTPAQVRYDYYGDGYIQIDLVDTDHRTIISKLAYSKGPVRGTTYINQSGAYYLRVSADDRRTSANPYPDTWFVQVTR